MSATSAKSILGFLSFLSFLSLRLRHAARGILVLTACPCRCKSHVSSVYVQIDR